MTGRKAPPHRTTSWVVLAAGALLVGGCQRGEAPAANQPARTAGPAGDPDVLNANRVMAAGVPIGKTTAPVDVRFNLGAVPHPGEPFALEVAVLPRGPVPLLQVDVSSSEGLTILEPAGQVRREKVQAGSLVHVHVRASAASTGTYIVQVRTTLELMDGSNADEFAFPIVVGERPPAAPATPPPGAASDTAPTPTSAHRNRR